MRTSTRLLVNSVANLASVVINTALALILTPIMVQHLGIDLFGVWGLTSPIILYAPLIFLGVSGSVTRFVAGYLAKGDYESINTCVNTARAYFCGGTVVLLALGVAVGIVLPNGMRIDPSLHSTAFWCILILTGWQAILFAFGPTAAVLYSLERFDLIALTQVAARAIRLAAIVVALVVFHPKPSTGLLLVAVIMGATDAGQYVAQSFLVGRHCPNLTISLRLARWEHVWPMIRFGLRSLLWTAVNILLPFAPLLVVGRYLSAGDVGHFKILDSALAFVSILVEAMVMATAPVAAKLAACDSAETLQVLLLRSAKYTMGVALAGSLFLGLLARVVLQLWVGDQFLHLANVLLVLSIGRSFWCLQSSSFNILFGMEKQGGLGVIGLVCTVVIGAVGSVVVGYCQGDILDMAIVLTLTIVVGCGIVMSIHTCRKVGVTWFAYVRQVYARPLAGVLPLTVMCLIIRGLPLRYAWFTLAGGLAGGAVLSLLGFWFLMFDDWDRELFRDRFGLLISRLSRKTPQS